MIEPQPRPPGAVPPGAIPPGGRPATAVAVQTGPASGDLEENLRAAGKLARGAEVRQALVVFPELFSRPFWCLGMSDPRYLIWAEPVAGPTVSFAAELAADLESVVVAPFFERGAVAGEHFNSVAVIGPDGRLLPGRLPDGTPVSVYRKNAASAYRWGEAVNDEKYYFKPGSGFAVFDTPLARIGVLICLDRWFPEAWRVLALRGAEVICVVNASAGDVDTLFVPMMQVCAAQNVVFTVAANRVGDEEVAGRHATYYGQSCIADPAGKVLAQASRDTPEALVATFDLDQVADVRQRRTMYRDRRPELYGAITEAPR
jgi:predicted amidohydrolase